MRYGLDLPNLGGCGDPHLLAELAHEAEEAGWDGAFVFDTVQSPAWDSLYGRDPDKRAVCDPWIALAAMALRTERLRIGTMVTPVSRRRPWKLARETVTLDHLSSGRLILPVGLGAPDDGGFSRVSEETDRKTRAQRLDEGLEILTGLWSGQPFSFRGEHYHVDEMTFLPQPVQVPRIPIWVVAAWPRIRSMRRALRWDGVIPAKMNDDGSSAEMTAADVEEMKSFIDEQRSPRAAFDIVVEGNSSGSNREKAISKVRPYEEAGATWWVEAVWTWLWSSPRELNSMRRRIRQGPPCVD